MKDKEMIEEMVEHIKRVIYNTEPDFNGYRVPRTVELAEELLKYYQPKLPEDSVVLSREEINNADYFYVKDGELIPVEKGRGKFITMEWYTELLMKMPLGHELAKERKETAKKILNGIGDIKIDKTMHSPTLMIVYNKVKELAKQFGVEIKE